jgi:hypothetical protein
MRTRHNLLILLIICFSAGACKKTLEETPKNFISSSLFYKTAADAEAAVLGIYSAGTTQLFRYQLLELHSDFAVGRGSWASVSFFDAVLDQNQIGRCRDYMWNFGYSIISRSNDVLAKVPPIDMDETKKKSLLAEARFMRAMAYFDLVRSFGAVPLRITPTQGTAQLGAKRAPEADIYNQIIEDLKVAEVDLPNSVGAFTARASKWAAKLLMAQVYLTTEKWADAAGKADEVITSGQYKLVSVAQPDDFYKIFAVNTSTEDVMSLQFSSTIQDDYPTTLHIPSVPAYNNSSTGFFTTVPRTGYALTTASWDNADLRKSFNYYTQYINAAGATVTLPAATPILFKKWIAAANGIRSNSRSLLRYAEAFLIYAEAETMADGTPSALALERLNIIRRRGYGKDFSVPSAIDFPAGMSASQFRDTVIRERVYELMNEQRRWWDLKRTGEAKQVIEAATGKPFNNSRLLFPIPQEEINSNPSLSQADQNPGY